MESGLGTILICPVMMGPRSLSVDELRGLIGGGVLASAQGRGDLISGILCCHVLPPTYSRTWQVFQLSGPDDIEQ